MPGQEAAPGRLHLSCGGVRVVADRRRSCRADEGRPARGPRVPWWTRRERPRRGCGDCGGEGDARARGRGRWSVRAIGSCWRRLRGKERVREVVGEDRHRVGHPRATCTPRSCLLIAIIGTQRNWRAGGADGGRRRRGLFVLAIFAHGGAARVRSRVCGAAVRHRTRDITLLPIGGLPPGPALARSAAAGIVGGARGPRGQHCHRRRRLGRAGAVRRGIPALDLMLAARYRRRTLPRGQRLARRLQPDSGVPHGRGAARCGRCWPSA